MPKATPIPATQYRPVIVCTKARGVFYGQVGDSDGWSLAGATLKLKAARMAIIWGTTHGVMQLAHTGPTGKSKIGAPADSELAEVTAIFEVTAAADLAWKEVK